MIVNPPARVILEVFDEGLCLVDDAGALCAMNEAAERLTGYREAELLGHRLLPKLEISTGSVDFGATALPGEPLAFSAPWRDTRLRRKDGEKIDAACSICPLPRSGQGGGAILKLRARERGAQDGTALRDTKVKLETIFGGMADGLVVIDEKGEIQMFSAGAQRLFGYRAEEALGADVKLLMPAPYREAHDGYLAEYLRTGVKKIIGVGREVHGLRKDGSTFPMYLSIGELWLDGRRYFVGVTHDLTRLRRTEERLLTLSAAVDQSPVAVMIANRDGSVEYVNNGFEQLTGYAAAELVGRNLCLLHSGEAAGDQRLRLCEALGAAGQHCREIQDRRKSGEAYWAHETIAPLRDASGDITHYLFIQEDVTQQKRDKEALAESEERFRHVAMMAGEWLWEQDPEGRYIYSSGAVRAILGMEPEEILGKSYLELFLMEAGANEQDEPSFEPTENLRPFFRLVNHYRHKDGHEVYTESTGAPIFDDAGRLIKWRGVDHDITSRKRYEDALRVRNRAIESVSVGIVICDAQLPGNPNVYVNPALSRITGYSHEELLAHSMNLLQGPETDPAALEEIRRAIANGESCEVTLKNYRKDGAAFWNELLISPVADDLGKITHYIGVQTDVTERRKAEESRHELEIAKQIQLSLLPSAPLRLPRVEVAGLCLPATHVGGDYFDYFHNSGDVDAVIADVSGHSVGAALIMTEVRSTLRAETRRSGAAPCGPGDVLRVLNDLLHKDLTRAELFITMFYFQFLSRTRTLKYANAGHNRALLLRSSQDECSLLDAEGLILGVKRGVDFEERSIELSAGDKLLFYTDGVTEAQNRHGDFFGIERLCDVFARRRDLAPEAMIGKVLADVREFCGGAPASDDIAMVVMAIS